MAFNWLSGKDETVPGEFNAYSAYAGGEGYQQPYTGGFMELPNSVEPKSDETSANSGWYGAGTGLGGYNTATTSTTGSTLTGAMNGYQSGGWMGAIVGGLSGYFGSKDKQKQGKKAFEQQMELELAKYKYLEEIRQKQMQETKDAFSKYTTGMAGPNRTPMSNNMLGGGMMGAFAPQGPTQPVVNPEQNSYGLMRG